MRAFLKLEKNHGFILYGILVISSIVVFCTQTKITYYPEYVEIQKDKVLIGGSTKETPFTKDHLGGHFFSSSRKYRVTDGYPVWYKVQIYAQTPGWLQIGWSGLCQAIACDDETTDGKNVGWIEAGLKTRDTDILFQIASIGVILKPDGLVLQDAPFRTGEPINRFPVGTHFRILDMEFSHLKLVQPGTEEWVATERSGDSKMIYAERKPMLMRIFFD